MEMEVLMVAALPNESLLSGVQYTIYLHYIYKGKQTGKGTGMNE
jgi:hypothetical protein